MADWRAELDRLQLDAATNRTLRLDEGWYAARRRSRRLARAALIVDVFGLSVDEWHDAHIDELPSDVASAHQRVAPDVHISEIASYSSQRLDGLINLVKGGLFEEQVINGLADGRLGDVVLPAHATVRLAEFTQEGFDVEVIDVHGKLIDTVQLKASDNADILARHLARFPDINEIWTTHEAAIAAAKHGLPAVDTGISDAALTHHVGAALSDQAHVSVGEFLDEVIPQVTLLLIAISWISARKAGVDSAEANTDAMSRVRQALLASAVAGVAAQLTGTDMVRIPVALAIRVIGARGQMASCAAENLRQLGDIIESARPTPSAFASRERVHGHV